mgnify:CR=1 FL=1
MPSINQTQSIDSHLSRCTKHATMECAERLLQSWFGAEKMEIDDSICPICNKAINLLSQDKLILPCGHRYHASCVLFKYYETLKNPNRENTFECVECGRSVDEAWLNKNKFDLYIRTRDYLEERDYAYESNMYLIDRVRDRQRNLEIQQERTKNDIKDMTERLKSIEGRLQMSKGEMESQRRLVKELVRIKMQDLGYDDMVDLLILPQLGVDLYEKSKM